MNRIDPRRPATATDPRTLTILGSAMAVGVVIFAGVAIGIAFAGADPPNPPTPLAWILCGLAVVALAASWTLPSDTAPRRLVSLALREACGLIGAVTTIVTGSATWAAALGLLSVASILAGVAAESGRAAQERHPGRPRLG